MSTHLVEPATKSEKKDILGFHALLFRDFENNDSKQFLTNEKGKYK